MREKGKTGFRVLFSFVLVLGAIIARTVPVSAAVTNADLANPVVDEGTHIDYGEHNTQYHYIYFGLFPQKEMWGDELTDAIRNASYDKDGIAWVDGKKYQRMSYDMVPEDKLNLPISRWEECCPEGYLYFLYEPVKWRILENHNGTLFLMSDKALDARVYNSTTGSSITWENCELRKWLNDDGSRAITYNNPNCYKTPGILLRGFTESERKRIKVTHLTQDSHPRYGLDGGEDTDDKVFVLSYTESTNVKYGFCPHIPINCSSRTTSKTDYALRMSLRGYFPDKSREEFKKETAKTSPNWLRTKGEEWYREMIVSDDGHIGFQMNTYGNVAPAMNVSCEPGDCIRISFVTNTDAKVEDQILLGSNYAKEPEGLVKEGYVMTGWYTDSACTKPYAFNYPLTKDTVLYAGWKRSTQAAPKGLSGGILKINGTTAAMEYAASIDKNAVWTACTEGSTAVPSAGKWYVRYRETKEAFAGQAAEVTVISLSEFRMENGIPGETLKVTDETITGMKDDRDVKGSSFGLLQARADRVTKNSIRLRWKKVKGADGYRIYGNRCGKKNRYRLIRTIKGAGKTTYTGKKLKKGTYYKYIVRAYKELGGEKVTVAVSKTVHAATSGGKYGNAKAVKLNKKKVTLKKGKTCKLKAAEIKKSKKINRHRKIEYESSDKKVATVSKKGVIKAVGKGSCTVYAYAQNGVYKKIRVKVK